MSKSSEEVKEEILSQIGLSKSNRDLYEKLYGNKNPKLNLFLNKQKEESEK